MTVESAAVYVLESAGTDTQMAAVWGSLGFCVNIEAQMRDRVLGNWAKHRHTNTHTHTHTATQWCRPLLNTKQSLRSPPVFSLLEKLVFTINVRGKQTIHRLFAVTTNTRNNNSIVVVKNKRLLCQQETCSDSCSTTPKPPLISSLVPLPNLLQYKPRAVTLWVRTLQLTLYVAVYLHFFLFLSCHKPIE